jgi:hypothetical protein
MKRSKLMTLLAVVVAAATLTTFYLIWPSRTMRLQALRSFEFIPGPLPDGFVGRQSAARNTLFVVGRNLGRMRVVDLRHEAQNVVLAYVDVTSAKDPAVLTQISKMGYDGVYLELPKGLPPARETVEAIAKIAADGRRQDRGFIVFAGGGACLPDRATYPGIDDDEYKVVSGLYWGSVDGVGLESPPDARNQHCVEAFPGHAKKVVKFYAR